MTLDIINASDISGDPKKFLIMGSPFTNKTGSLVTLPRPLLIFAGDSSCQRRLGGLPDVHIINCFTEQGKDSGEGIRKFDLNFKELLSMKNCPYKSIAFDPYNFLHDFKFSDALGDDTGNDKRGMAAYGHAKRFGTQVLDGLMGFPGYVVVICHIKLFETNTKAVNDPSKPNSQWKVKVATGETQNVFLPAIEGSLKDTFIGRFDAVFYTKEHLQPMKPTTYKWRWKADKEHLCGIKIPVAKQHLLEKLPEFLEQDFGKLLTLLEGKEGG